LNRSLHPVSFKKKGYVLVITMFLLLLLTVIGIAATRTSIVEVQISGNYRQMVQDFYACEGALVNAMERLDWWLSDGFLNSDTGTANWSGKVDIDGDTIEDAMVEIRCVEPSHSEITALSTAANDVPADPHTASPPIGSGYSARHFYIRKYAITTTGLRSNTKLQAGVWKVFNKY
jgi:Tfp pilus assembly protein PilX